MSKFFDKSLREVIEVSASTSPTPGGGSVSALAACFGVAMTAMVSGLTLGKEKYKDVQPEVTDILEAAKALLSRLEELVEVDIAEFNNFMAAYRLPRGTDVEKQMRETAMQKALKGATDTPMEIAGVCLKVLRLTDRLSTIGIKMAISDVGVAALMAEAALEGVLLSVEINTPMISDRDYVLRIIREKEQMSAEAKILRDAILAVVRDRIGGGS
ncbi:MAG: cyclodeaminase/cyclohydrolase family protein [Desulfotomaculaceae bacterium]